MSQATARRADDSGVLCEVRRGIGWITLNRPSVINALNHSMVRHIDAALQDWATDDGVAGVVLRGRGLKGLCAGGDIVAIYHHARAGAVDAVLTHWRDEYTLNARIAEYAKPYLAVMDGIVMGGGVGSLLTETCEW